MKEKVSNSMSIAIGNFTEKNFLPIDKISVMPLNEEKAIIRIFQDGWTVLMNREAENNIYNGESTDMFNWKCISRSSGMISLMK